MNPSWHDLTLKLGISAPNTKDIINALVRRELPNKADRIKIDKNDIKVVINYKDYNEYNSNSWIEKKSTFQIHHCNDDGKYHIYINGCEEKHVNNAKFLEKNTTAITNALRRYPSAIIELEKRNEEMRTLAYIKLDEEKEITSRMWKRFK